MPTTTYRMLFRVGYWGSLDAACETSTDTELALINHSVQFRLINKMGEHLDMGLALLTGQSHTALVWDENGETFPTLDLAIRAHAEELLRITAMPGRPIAKPPRYETWQGTTATSF